MFCAPANGALLSIPSFAVGAAALSGRKKKHSRSYACMGYAAGLPVCRTGQRGKGGKVIRTSLRATIFLRAPCMGAGGCTKALQGRKIPAKSLPMGNLSMDFQALVRQTYRSDVTGISADFSLSDRISVWETVIQKPRCRYLVR